MGRGIHLFGKARPYRDKGYVSEFTGFMNQFLAEHPEEIEKRRKGWLLYWDHKVDLADRERAQRDNVRDQRYGFDYSAWRSMQAGTPGEEPRNG